MADKLHNCIKCGKGISKHEWVRHAGHCKKCWELVKDDYKD